MKTTALAALLSTGCILANLTTSPAFAAEKAAQADVELWRLDGGEVQVNELNAFSDVDAFDGQHRLLPVGVYLIRHGATYMLWDTGLPRTLLGKPINRKDTMSATVHKPLIDQIKQLSIAPEKITLIGLSHTHFDHSGQAADFPNATLMLGRRDLAGLTANPTPPNVAPDMLAHWVKEGGKITVVDGDQDVFGDGSVRMVSTPGHTAGHHSLLVTLRGKGPVLLTGDVWNFKEQVPIHGVPPFAADRADAIASEDRLTQLAQHRHALVVIQHEPEDVTMLPRFPASAR